MPPVRSAATAASLLLALAALPLALAAWRPAPTRHVIALVDDARGPRFEPATLTVRRGDVVAWVKRTDGPSAIAFPDTAAAAPGVLGGGTAVRAATLDARPLLPLPEVRTGSGWAGPSGPHASPVLFVGDTLLLTVDGPAGTYRYRDLAGEGMQAGIRVQGTLVVRE